MSNEFNPSISGSYNFSNHVNIEVNKVFSHENDFFITSIHEIMHMSLTRSTSFGALNFIIEASRNYALENMNFPLERLFFSYSKLLIQSSDIVQESVAYYMQYAAIKKTDYNNFKKSLDSLEVTSAYKQYKLKHILKYTQETSWEKILNSKLIIRIGFLSMNIEKSTLFNNEILDLDILEYLLIKQKLAFNPNYRFSLLLKALDKLLKTEKIEDITDELLLKKSDLLSNSYDKNEFLSFCDFIKAIFIKNNYPTIHLEIIQKNSLSEISDEVETEVEIFKLIDLMRPISMNLSYKTSFFENFEQLENIALFEPLTCLRIILLGNYYQLIYEDAIRGLAYHAFIESKTIVDHFISITSTPFLFFLCDYNSLLYNFPALKDKKIFLYHEASYLSSKELINNIISPGREFMFHKINDSTFASFYKCNNNTSLVMIHPIQLMLYILKDLKQNLYNYINTSGLIDNVFFYNNKDWTIYEDILRVLTHTTVFSSVTKTQTLGYRINLDFEEI